MTFHSLNLSGRAYGVDKILVFVTFGSRYWYLEGRIMSNEQPSAPRAYELLEIREFKSSIPPHLLGKLSESERYLVETMSRLENQNNWLVNALLKVNKDVLDCDRRITETNRNVATVSDWKQLMSGKWAVLAAISLILLSVLAKFLLDALWHLLKP
jgi:hypothetical protein